MRRMEKLLYLVGLLAAAAALYALGRLHGRDREREHLARREQAMYQTGHEAGWRTCYRAWLTWSREESRPRGVSRNAAAGLYQTRVSPQRAADDTVWLQPVA